MGFLALILLVLAGWLILTGRLQRMTMTDGLMLGISIVGAVMAARGQSLFGGAALAVSALHGWRRMGWGLTSREARRTRKAAKAAASAPPAPKTYSYQDIADARALLGLDESADEEAIRAAHRRLIAKNHPDVGGTRALAEKINDARTILLRHATENKKSHSSPSDSPQDPTGSS